MHNFKVILGLLAFLVASIISPSENLRAECSADNQATYASCIESAATSCSSSLTDCNDTTLVTTNSAVLVNRVVDKCCAKSTEAGQLSCAKLQISRLATARLAIPANLYSKFRQTAAAAIKELKALRKNKTLCDTGSN